MAKNNPRPNPGKSGSRFKSAFSKAQRAKQARSGAGANSQQQPRTPRPLRGASIIDFAERQIDYSKSLLGNRWLSIEQGAFIVAPSGHGKSTLVIQAAACWSCGLTAFSIHPVRPLRVLVIQSEDDDNDIIEMAMLTDRLGLSVDQRELVRKNTHLEWLNDVTGQEFFNVADDFLTAFPADVLIINPYSAYQGGDIWDDELNNAFLRIRLSALLTKHHCGALVVHHTPKTQYQKIGELSWFDWMYTMAGGSALTNWARGVMIIVPSAMPGTYKFIAAKRFEKIGWQDREYWFSHSVENGKFLWVPATQAQIAAAKGGHHAVPDDVLTLIPVLDPISQEELWQLAEQKLNISERTTRKHCNILIDKKKIFIHKIPRQGTKSAVGYAQTPPSI
jgi:AAA domain